MLIYLLIKLVPLTLDSFYLYELNILTTFITIMFIIIARDNNVDFDGKYWHNMYCY